MNICIIEYTKTLVNYKGSKQFLSFEMLECIYYIRQTYVLNTIEDFQN